MGQDKSCIKEKTDWVLGKKPQTMLEEIPQ